MHVFSQVNFAKGQPNEDKIFFTGAWRPDVNFMPTSTELTCELGNTVLYPTKLGVKMVSKDTNTHRDYSCKSNISLGGNSASTTSLSRKNLWRIRRLMM